MNQTTIPLEKPRVIHVPRDREMAAKVKHIESLRDKKKRDAANTQALIDSELDDLNALADVVLNAEQVDLPFEEEATAALAKIAGTCSPADAIACPKCGDCSCIPEGDINLVCAFCKEFGIEPPALAVCIGVSAEKGERGLESPACDVHCGHEQTLMKCRPVTPEDQPQAPTTAPAVKAIDCPLHGVDSKHATGPGDPPEMAEALAAEMPPDPEEPSGEVLAAIEEIERAEDAGEPINPEGTE